MRLWSNVRIGLRPGSSISRHSTLARHTVDEGDSEGVTIALCGQGGCDRRRLTAGRCLVHADPKHLAAATRRWRLGESIDLRGAQIDGISLQRLLAAISRAGYDTHPAPLSPDRRAEIWCDINFEGAKFLNDAHFHGVVFKGAAYFDHAKFHGYADFGEAEFSQHADFDSTTFERDANFRGAIFDDHAGFQKARFVGEARFVSAKFRSYVDFEHTSFGGSADMAEVSFQFARRLGPLEVGEQLLLDKCEFAERTSIEVVASEVSASSAIFADGVRFLVAAAVVGLECVDFGRASTLSGPSGSGVVEGAGVQERREAKPRLMSLHGAQVSSLAISGVDLRHCSFFGAHGLETMTIEPNCDWLHTPLRRRVIDRQLIDEERRWRVLRELRRRAEGWREAPVWTGGIWGEEEPHLERPGEPELEPGDLAALYRALRKAREENKDQAGAGDLYYGEMEMRRASRHPGGRGRIRAAADRSIITAYWLLSGYGLKASRAFGAWLLLTAAATLALKTWGITHEPSLSRAALFAVECTSSLIRPAHLPNPYKLKESGEAIQLALRLTGPVLIGLFLLALRARVKR
jgi:uncharacterized protein YjbI with pentapeptide repeats